MFRKNVNTIKASVWIRQLNILCYSAGKWTIWKQSSRLGDTSRFDFTLAYMRSFWLTEGISRVKIWISHRLLIIPGCLCWLQIKLLTNLMFESVLTERRQQLSGCISTLPENQFFLQNNTKCAFPLSGWKLSSHSVNSPAFLNSQSFN